MPDRMLPVPHVGTVPCGDAAYRVACPALGPRRVQICEAADHTAAGLGSRTAQLIAISTILPPAGEHRLAVWGPGLQGGGKRASLLSNMAAHHELDLHRLQAVERKMTALPLRDVMQSSQQPSGSGSSCRDPRAACPGHDLVAVQACSVLRRAPAAAGPHLK